MNNLSKEKVHKHEWTTHGMNYYHIGGTRLWLFRKCSGRKCEEVQEAIVDTDKLIRWRKTKCY